MLGRYLQVINQLTRARAIKRVINHHMPTKIIKYSPFSQAVQMRLYGIALKLRGSLILQISQIWNNSENYLTKLLTLLLYNQLCFNIGSRVHRPNALYYLRFRCFKSVDGRYPGPKYMYSVTFFSHINSAVFAAAP